MTTIGFPFEDLRPRVVRPKKSFMQRLNEGHEQLLSHMRSLKIDEPPLPTKQSSERTRAVSTSENTPPRSTTSSSDSERDSLHYATKYTEIDYDSPSSTGLLSPPLSPRDGSFHVQQFLTPRDRKTSKEFVHGMQSFISWKQASYESSLGSMSPPQTPQSSHSWVSSRSTRSEMSDEQIDDWLERPIDADVHRYRKLSEVSTSWLDDLSDDEDDLKIHVIKEQPDEEDAALCQSRRASSVYPEDWMRLKEAQNEDPASEDDVTPTGNASDRKSKLLSLPDELLQNIAFHVQPEHAQPFRLSCMRLYDLISESTI